MSGHGGASSSVISELASCAGVYRASSRACSAGRASVHNIAVGIPLGAIVTYAEGCYCRIFRTSSRSAASSHGTCGKASGRQSTAGYVACVGGIRGG